MIAVQATSFGFQCKMSSFPNIMSLLKNLIFHSVQYFFDYKIRTAHKKNRMNPKYEVMWSLNAELALFNFTGSSMMVYCTSDGVSCLSTVLFSDVLFLYFDIRVVFCTLISFVGVVKVETVVVFNPFELDCCPLWFFFPLCLCFPCFLRLWVVANNVVDVAGTLDDVWSIEIVCAWPGLAVTSIYCSRFFLEIRRRWWYCCTLCNYWIGKSCTSGSRRSSGRSYSSRCGCRCKCSWNFWQSKEGFI